MKRLKKIALIGVTTLALIVIVVVVVKYRADRAYYDGYNASLPLNTAIRGTETRDQYTRIEFTYESIPGEEVPSVLALPLDAPKPYPCIIFLHGMGQNKKFLDEIAGFYTTAGFAIVSFDQYTRGERKLESSNLISGLFGLRRRAAMNVIDTRRLVDYLETRDDIAKKRIYLVGASFGAITGSTAVAFEPRIPAAVMTYGGGDLYLLFTSKAAHDRLGRWNGPVASLLAYVTSPSDPVKYVGRIAPRPVLFQNGDHDQLISMAAAQALIDAAGEPKDVKIYDSDHVGVDEEQTVGVLKDSIAWLLKQDQKIVAASQSPKNSADQPSAVPASVSSPASSLLSAAS